MLLFRELPFCTPIKTISTWFTKQINILYKQSDLFSQKNSEHYSKKCPWWSSITIKSQIKVTEAGFWHFSRAFSFFSEQPLCRAHTNVFFWYLVFFWSLNVFLCFDRETLLSSLSEPATNMDSKEKLLWKFPEKSPICPKGVQLYSWFYII